MDFWPTVYVFVLASFIGLGIIRRVSRLLHTPLMSLTNAISAITVVGSIVIAGEQKTTLSTVLGTIAVTASMINIVGGYLITPLPQRNTHGGTRLTVQVRAGESITTLVRFIGFPQME